MTSQSSNRLLQQRANVLISAWNSGDCLHLEAALLQDPTPSDSFDERDSEHSERDEVVEVAEGAMRAWLRNPTPETHLDVQVSLRLLKHLASCESLSAFA